MFTTPQPVKKKRDQQNDNHQEEQIKPDDLKEGLKLNRFVTIPRTFRLSEVNMYLLDCLAAQMDTSSSRLLSELLDDILPKFLGEKSEVEIQLMTYYLMLRRAKVLKKVNPDELITKIRMTSHVKPRGIHVDME